jgi:hypothetical protein
MRKAIALLKRALPGQVPRLVLLRVFDIDQRLKSRAWHVRPMATFLFRCPNTTFRVQGWVAEDTSGDEATFAPVECAACRQLHYVNPASGRVLGAAADDD